MKRKQIALIDKYKPLFNNDTRYFLVTGGRGSGKSFSVAVFLLNLTFQENHKILFTRYTLVSAATSIIPEFIEKIELMGYEDIFRITKDSIINLKTKSEIYFKGIRTSSGNQTAALKSLSQVSTFVLDEAEELIDPKTFDKIDFSIRSTDVQNRCILIMNPTTKAHWVYQRWLEPHSIPDGYNGIHEDVTYIHTTWEDNRENLSDSFKEQIQTMKKQRPDEYLHQIMGGWLSKAEGTIIKNWKVGRYEQQELTCYCQDWGFSVDPTVLCQISVDPDSRKMWVRECYSEVGLSTNEIASLNRMHAGLDLIIADNSEGRLLDELVKMDLNMKPTRKYKGSVLSGIALMQGYQIIVEHNSHGIMKEFNNYTWKETGTSPRDLHNHFCDAIRYGLMYLVKGRNTGTYVIR